MGKTTRAIILVSTALLIVVSSIKLFLAQPDLLDKLLAIFTVILFFFDQITR
jgi:hypothetical protein